MSKPLHQ